MRAALRPWFLGAMTLGLLACQPLEASAKVQSTMTGRALVIRGTSDGEVDWGSRISLAGAPAGEYFIFESAEAPTSLAGVDGFDPGTCSSDCKLAGLGTLLRRDSSDGTKIESKSYASYLDFYDDSETRYYTIVRRDASGTAPINVTGAIDISGGGACDSELDPPSLSYPSPPVQ